MPDTMIERVARGIAEAVRQQSDSGVDPKWSDFRDEARAAIEAMREPSAAMAKAAAEACPALLGIDPSDVVKALNAAIDAALAEER